MEVVVVKEARMFDLSKDSKTKARIVSKRIAADRITPIQILEKMKAVALLESAYHETGKGKYSILILKEAFTLYKESDKYFLKNADNDKKFLLSTSKNFLYLLEEFRKRAPIAEGLSEFPIPLGGLGYLGFEFFGEIEEVEFKKPNDRGLFDDAFIFGRNFMIFDHLHDEALLVAVSYEGEIEEIDLENEIVSIESHIAETVRSGYEETAETAFSAKIVSADDRDEFIRKVNIVKDELYKGNLLQCVLSRRVEIESDIAPVNAYRNLRMQNPSPYMFYIDFKTFVLFGASPEVCVKSGKGEALLKPIAGTRRRGIDAGEDLALEEELQKDPKERAEHLMLVDLARNDLGKISIGGGVKVTQEFIVERYSRVMHLVSEVVGTMEKNKTSSDVILATFPAGTVSGAPKIQAIKTIEWLEDYRRGPYSGLVGYFEKDGSLDSCIAIRSAIYRSGRIWLQAGAGLVFDSVPETEYEETQNKMMALFNSLNLELER